MGQSASGIPHASEAPKASADLYTQFHESSKKLLDGAAELAKLAKPATKVPNGIALKPSSETASVTEAFLSKRITALQTLRSMMNSDPAMAGERDNIHKVLNEMERRLKNPIEAYSPKSDHTKTDATLPELQARADDAMKAGDPSFNHPFAQGRWGDKAKNFKDLDNQLISLIKARDNVNSMITHLGSLSTQKGMAAWGTLIAEHEKKPADFQNLRMPLPNWDKTRPNLAHGAFMQNSQTQAIQNMQARSQANRLQGLANSFAPDPSQPGQNHNPFSNFSF